MKKNSAKTNKIAANIDHSQSLQKDKKSSRAKGRKINNIRHSLAHILAMAVLEKYPDAKLGIGPTIEDGFYYDFLLPTPISDSDLPKLEERMRQLIKMQLKFKGEKVSPQKARRMFKDQPFKLDLIKEFVKEKKQLTIYHTYLADKSHKDAQSSGVYFTDLCQGGHIKTSADIPIDAFVLTKTAGAYWRGDENNPMLTRIYGAAFESKKDLDNYLWQQEEAKKRDHRVLGARLKIFAFAQEVGPGLPLWLPKGTALRDALEQYAKDVERAWGYQRVSTPHIAKEELYRLSGHIPYYAESMFPPMELDDGNYYLKAMNCPHTHMIYKAEMHSYRDLPLRLAEYGTVYRYERSGTLAGLLRVRGFTQNDAHIYCTKEQAKDEFLKVMRLHEFWYKYVFGIKDFYMRLSLPAKDKQKYVDMPKGWKESVSIVRKAMRESGLDYVEAEGEAAFYGPKIDFQIKSVIGREETASTNQLDFLSAKRFGLVYTDKDGREKEVFVIHRAPLGAHERFIAFLLEHYAGSFPVWLAPVQIAVMPIAEEQKEYAREIFSILFEAGLRAEFYGANTTLAKRIREAEMQKVPFIAVVGRREKETRKVSLRTRDKKSENVITLSSFVSYIKKEAKPPAIRVLS